MTIAEQLARAKTDLDDVYEAGYNKGLNDAPPSGDYQDGFEAGKQAEYDAFWDGYQDGGNRTNYQYAFSGNGWSIYNFKPKFDILPIRCDYAFSQNDNMFDVDFSDLLKTLGVLLDTSNATNINYMFMYCRFKRVPEIRTEQTISLAYTFSNSNIETVDKIVLRSEGNQSFNNTFQKCERLKNIQFEGTIGESISFAQSSLLEVSSMDNIYEHLKDYTSASGTYTLTLHANAWERWDDAKPDIVAQYGSMKNYVTTTKGWATS